jgi:tetratricopeptide (TPR) repeat protein
MFMLVCSVANSQDINGLLKQAGQHEAALRENDALQAYLEVLKHQPANMVALCKTSELYNVLGKRQAKKDAQRQYYNNAHKYAKLALKTNPNSSEANFVMALSMGRIALMASGEEKINAVKDIKNYADRCIQLDPTNYKGYHVLGKWHYEVSDLNSVERWLVKVTFGGLPKSTLEDSIKNYEKSRQLNPTFILNYLELAKAYRRQDEKNKAIALLEAMMKLSPVAADDVKIKNMGKKLLDDLKS